MVNFIRIQMVASVKPKLGGLLDIARYISSGARGYPTRLLRSAAYWICPDKSVIRSGLISMLCQDSPSAGIGNQERVISSIMYVVFFINYRKQLH